MTCLQVYSVSFYILLALVIANFYQMKENCQKLELNLNTVKLSVRQRQSSTFPMKKNLYYKKA